MSALCSQMLSSLCQKRWYIQRVLTVKPTETTLDATEAHERLRVQRDL